MLLRDIIANLESVDDTLCIVAKRPWRSDCDARLVRLTSDFRIPVQVLAEDYEYFLEVHVAIEEVLGNLGAPLSPEQRVDAILYYAENDAFPDWLTSLSV